MALVVLPVHMPAVLAGQSNGQLPLPILVSTPGLGGGPTVRFVPPASRAWRALSGSAPMVLKATSLADSYRSYVQQEATFTSRYEPDPFPGFISTKIWPAHYDLQGRFVEAHRWYQKPDTAVAAIPGTSNHGWGLAIDVANASGSRLDWLEANAPTFGWSWETVPSEPWHIRYVAGDTIPPAVLAYEETNEMTPDEHRMLANLDRELTAHLVDADEVTHLNGDQTYPLAWSARLKRVETQVGQILAILQAGVPVPGEVIVADVSVQAIAEAVADEQHERQAE